MKTIGSLALLAAVLLPAGRVARGQSEDLGKVAEAAAVAQYRLLFGEEVPILVERAFATLNEMLPKIGALWGTGRQPGKLEEQWVAAATALSDDMVLYLRSAVDAARDALKEGQGKGTEADLTQLEARVEKTLDYLAHVVGKKGAEVAMFRDVAQGWVDALKAYKQHMPAVLLTLKAEPAFARDTATRVEKVLKDPGAALGELQEELRALDVARRGLVAAKNQALGRRTQIAAYLKTIAPETLLSALRKASEGWIPPDNGAGTFVSASHRELMGKWPADLESGMTRQYAELYREAMEAVKPLLAGDFHRGLGPIYDSVSLENLDKVLDPHFAGVRKAIERARQAEMGERDLDHAEKALDGELAEAGKRAERVEAARKAGQLIRDAASRASHEADRRAYQKIAERWNAAERRWEDAERDLERLVKAKEELKPRRPRGEASRDLVALRQHYGALGAIQRQVEECRRRLEAAAAEMEEIREQHEDLKARIRGD